MKSVLYELYHGNIDPSSFYEPLLKEHRHFLKRECNRFEQLEEELEKDNPKLKKVFDEVLDFAFIDARWNTSNSFMQGFSLGVRMMAEAYCLDLSAKEN